jgi:hypothetical protein
MGSMSKADQPGFFRSELGKTINMFFSQLNSQMQFYVTDVRKNKEMAIFVGGRGKLLTRAITSIIMVGFLEQGKGRLSKRAISNEFNALTVDEIRSIEEQYQLVFFEK